MIERMLAALDLVGCLRLLICGGCLGRELLPFFVVRRMM